MRQRMERVYPQQLAQLVRLIHSDAQQQRQEEEQLGHGDRVGGVLASSSPRKVVVAGDFNVPFDNPPLYHQLCAAMEGEAGLVHVTRALFEGGAVKEGGGGDGGKGEDEDEDEDDDGGGGDQEGTKGGKKAFSLCTVNPPGEIALTGGGRTPRIVDYAFASSAGGRGEGGESSPTECAVLAQKMDQAGGSKGGAGGWNKTGGGTGCPYEYVSDHLALSFTVRVR